MKRLLFVAGEPGSGKTEFVSRPLSQKGLGLVLHTDRISQRAAKHYHSEKPAGCKWELWKLEFDKNHNGEELEAALFRSMKERRGKPVHEACNVIVEGVLSGHPAFRRTMVAILAEFGFVAEEIRTLALCPTREQVLRNLARRKRAEDHDLEFIIRRSDDYQRRLADQPDVKRFVNTGECYQAAVDFLSLPPPSSRS